MKIAARCRDGNGNFLDGVILNISLGGAYIMTGLPMSKGKDLVIEIQAGHLGKIRDIKGIVVRQESKGMAVEFTDKESSQMKELLMSLRKLMNTDSRKETAQDEEPSPRVYVLRNTRNMTNKSDTDHDHGDKVKKDKRKHSRKLLRIEARYQDAEAKVLKGTVRNISLSGVFIETPYPLSLHTSMNISLDATDLGKVIDVSGRVVRIEQNKGMAIEFDSKDNREIKLLLSTLRKLDQASMLALSRSALGD